MQLPALRAAADAGDLIPATKGRLARHCTRMRFPADIMGCMKVCILAVFWPRKDIFGFFREHDCPAADLREIDGFKEKNLSRSAMVDKMFERLAARADGGLGPFRAMLQSLVAWDRFDPYYFDRLGKLDRAAAQQCIAHLRQLQEIRDAKIKEDRKRREDEQLRAQHPQRNLSQLRDEFLRLHSGELKPQNRGYALEKLLADLARTESLEVTEPFKVHGEQIDGAVKYDGEHYLLEAKWQDRAAANEPVYQFAGKIDGKMYGRGIFVSVQGFSANVIESLVRGKAIHTILVDGEDLVLVLEEQISFRDMIDRKVKAAQTRGLIYVNPITGDSKHGAG